MHNILLGITGGIAAYKCPDIVRRLRDVGCQVRVVMTDAAKAFITPMTMQAVSGQPIPEGLFDLEFESAMGHIELARWADHICIAPASADFIARLAHGHANDLLTTLCLASRAPITIAPAMNQQMWQAKVVQENIEKCLARHIQIIGPAIGAQACGEFGPGRMSEPQDIVAQLLLTKPLFQQQHIVITAGPTREKIDPVRFISNFSSGKMGLALAEAAAAAGAHVTLIAGPGVGACSPKIKRIDVCSAAQMHAASLQQIRDAMVFIACAAVADYRVADIATQKIKKTSETLTLTLCKNPDILADIAVKYPSVYCVGFAAETENVIDNAKQKRQAKNLDLIVANLVGDTGTDDGVGGLVGFESDVNAVTLITAKDVLSLPQQSKTLIAKQIIDFIAQQVRLTPQKDAQHEFQHEQ